MFSDNSKIKNTNNYEKKLNVLCVVCSICIALLVVPILIVSFMSIPYADDFSYASNVREDAEIYGGIVVALFTRVWTEYMTFEGGMFKVFLMNVGAVPMLKGGIVGLRIYIVCCHLAFYTGLFWFLGTVFNERLISKDRLKLLLEVIVIIVFWIVNNRINREMYTWGLIQSAFVIPVIAMMIGLGLYIRYRNTIHEGRKRVLLCIFSSVLLFLVGGAPLNIVVLNCGLLIIACYYEYIEKGYDRWDWIVIGAALLGMIINLISPGNASRHGADWGIILFIKTYIVAIWHVFNKIGLLITETPFLPLCCVLLLIMYKGISYNDNEKITYDHPVFFAGFLLFGASIVNWPYTFGNSITSFGSFEGRCEWVSDCTVYALTVIWLVYLSKYIKKTVKLEIKEKEKVYSLTIGLMIAISVIIVLCKGIDNFTTPYMIKSLKNGSIKKYCEYQENILKEIEDGNGDIYIRYNCDEVDKNNPVIAGLRLGDDPSDSGLFWRNHAVARYYGKQNVYVEYYSNE